MDIVGDLGPFALASRLRRLSDRLKADATRFYRDQGVDINDNWFLLGVALSRHGSMTIGEAANALGFSRTAVSQMAVLMAKEGLIIMNGGAEHNGHSNGNGNGNGNGSDRRYKPMVLTDKGRETIAKLEPLWQAVAACTEELLAASEHDVLQGLSDIERELDEMNLFSRVVARQAGWSR